MTVKYIHPTAARAATGLTAQVYAQIRPEFGALVEPFTLHSPLPPVLAGVWMACREALLVGQVPRVMKEAVAAAVSHLNRCPYCVDAHTMMLHGLLAHDVAQAISAGRMEAVGDARLRALVEWAYATRSPQAAALRAPPFARQDAPDLIGTAVLFHYINRMVSVLLGDTPLPNRRPLLKERLKRVAAWYFARAIRSEKHPGAALDLLPGVALPPDFAWAEGKPHVAGAFARFAAVVEAAGAAVLPADVRALVVARLALWDGSDPGLSRRWVEEALQGLDETAQAAGRLALLTAFAPHQVDAAVVQCFTAWRPGEADLVAALAWASLAAARRIGTWLHGA